MKGSLTAELIEAVGGDATRQLMRSFGGRYLYFPEAENLSAQHPLVVALGAAAADTLCRKYSGLRLLIPMGYHTYVRERNAQIRAARQQGQTIAQLSQAFNLSPRNIHYVLARPASEDAALHPDQSAANSEQLGLFDAGKT